MKPLRFPKPSKLTYFIVGIIFSFVLFGSIFFYFRLQYLEKICTDPILNEFETTQWGAGQELTTEQLTKLEETKFFYLVESQRRCMESQKFFFLF